VVVRARASRDALLVLADNYYPGWEATVDDEPEAIVRVNHTFRGVPLPAGEHTVVFEYRPAAVYRGLWLGVGGLVVLLVAGIADILFHRRAPGEA
jgi:uncharacterized membrane protein YfhO